MLKVTFSVIHKLQLDEPFGPVIATRKEIHRAQANLYNYKSRFPGAEFTNVSKPYLRILPDGKKEAIKGWYEFTITRKSFGYNADTGEPE